MQLVNIASSCQGAFMFDKERVASLFGKGISDDVRFFSERVVCFAILRALQPKLRMVVVAYTGTGYTTLFARKSALITWFLVEPRSFKWFFLIKCFEE